MWHTLYGLQKWVFFLATSIQKLGARGSDIFTFLLLLFSYLICMAAECYGIQDFVTFNFVSYKLICSVGVVHSSCWQLWQGMVYMYSCLKIMYICKAQNGTLKKSRFFFGRLNNY